AGYLEKMFRALNAKYFDGVLEEPIITIQSTPRAYGHVTVGKAWRKGQDNRHELNIGAGTLDRPIENIVATLLHEMVHLWNLQNDIQDCSRGGAYHNKKFRDAATARDLQISYDPKIGWSVTQPTSELCDFIIEQDWSDIKMSRIEWSYSPRGAGSGNANGGTVTPPTAAGSTRKYICPCCGMSIRATKAVNIKCMDCDAQLILAK
ncbi:MAG: SprT-like domain-containing protein, partial [Ruthenibacterium sp.]